MEKIFSPTGLEEKFFNLCTEVVKEVGLGLYDLEYFPGQSLLRIYVLNEETDTAVIEDCVKVDRALTPYVEELEWMPEELNLEVSSPGVYRSLKTWDHLKKYEGHLIKLETYKRPSFEGIQDLPKSLIGQKKFRGVLKILTDEKVGLEIKETVVEFKLSEIKKAALDPEF